MASLVVMGPPATGVRFPLTSKQEVVIGRSGFCDIVLNKRSVSREHARVFERDGHFFITDLDSINGTFVNGHPIHNPTQLQDGDRINLFDVPLAFYLYDDFAAPSTTTLSTFDHEAPAPLTQRVETSNPRLQSRLNSLVDIACALGSSLNIEEILPKVLDIVFRIFPQAVNGEILLMDADSQLTPRANKHGRDDDSAVLTVVPYNHEPAQKVMETRRGLVVNAGDESNDSVLDGNFTSTMYVPMIGSTRTPFGVIVLEADDVTSQFTEDDLHLVTGVATMAAQAIGYARAHESMIESEITRHHLDTARQIQLRMLPRECPKVSGYEFAHYYYRAAQTVGGDAYIYHTLPDGRIVLGVADASGKGLPACLKIVEFNSELRHCVSTAPSLKAAMEHLNRFVCKFDEGFITFCLAVLDPKRHTLSIVNAGHPLPLLRHPSGSITALGAGRVSFPLGLEPNEAYHPFTISVNEGDQFVVFSDGLTEAFDVDEKLYGSDRLHSALAQPMTGANLRVKAIVNDVEQFRRGKKPSDDLCIVVAVRNG
jgi:phosphoserine phosphatase RsbU/P